MTESEQERVARLFKHPTPTVSTEVGLSIAETLNKAASNAGLQCALAGGIAMHVYGFVRATKDVDLIANGRLDLKIVRYLRFGGETYEVSFNNQNVIVDWIIRRDSWRLIYEQALKDAVEYQNGIKIVTPEWLTVMKYIAGRPKDEIDLIWLLQQPNLVNRKKLGENLTKLLGEAAAQAYILGLRRFYDLADLSKARGDGDENESYRESDYPEYNN